MISKTQEQFRDVAVNSSNKLREEPKTEEILATKNKDNFKILTSFIDT